jgi:hypothetical protein
MIKAACTHPRRGLERSIGFNQGDGLRIAKQQGPVMSGKMKVSVQGARTFLPKSRPDKIGSESSLAKY